MYDLNKLVGEELKKDKNVDERVVGKAPTKEENIETYANVNGKWERVPTPTGGKGEWELTEVTNNKGVSVMVGNPTYLDDRVAIESVKDGSKTEEQASEDN